MTITHRLRQDSTNLHGTKWCVYVFRFGFDWPADVYSFSYSVVWSNNSKWYPKTFQKRERKKCFWSTVAPQQNESTWITCASHYLLGLTFIYSSSQTSLRNSWVDGAAWLTTRVRIGKRRQQRRRLSSPVSGSCLRKMMEKRSSTSSSHWGFPRHLRCRGHSRFLRYITAEAQKVFSWSIYNVGVTGSLLVTIWLSGF